MANFDLGSAKCRAKERANGAIADYVIYGRFHKIELSDDTTEIGKNFNELWNMSVKIGKCTTEEELNKCLERIS